MKDEIKEIIDNLIRFRNEDNNFQSEDILTIEDVWLLLDYITNLQEENERLKNRNDFLEKVCVGFDDKYENYKSRNEKAINILNKIDLDKYVYTKTRQKEIIKDLLNILNGGDEK